MKSSIKIIVSFFLFMLWGCNINGTYLNEESEKKDAEKITEKFYVLNGLKKNDKLETLFSDEFFKVSSSEDLQRILQMTNTRLGGFKSKKLVDWKTIRVTGSKASTEYFLTYDVLYDKFSAKENFRLMKEGDEIKILSYNVNSDGFMQ